MSRDLPDPIEYSLAGIRAALERIADALEQANAEDCDCIQPRIERITPNREAGYPWIRREVVWEGTFVCVDSGYPEGVTYETLEDELRAACQEFRIEYPEKVES